MNSHPTPWERNLDLACCVLQVSMAGCFSKGSISPRATVGKVAVSLPEQGSHMMELLPRPESKELQSWLSSAPEL